MKTMAVIALLMIVFASYALAALKINDDAPQFSLRDSAGNKYTLNDLVGPTKKESNNGVVLSFFASWCTPCRNELPLMNALADELKGKGIHVVLVDVKEDFATIKNLLAELKVDKPIVLSDRNGKTSEEYQIRFLPMTFFIGSDAKIKTIIFGEIKERAVLKANAWKLLR